jgi:hypothetical protein
MLLLGFQSLNKFLFKFLFKIEKIQNLCCEIGFGGIELKESSLILGELSFGGLGIGEQMNEKGDNVNWGFGVAPQFLLGSILGENSDVLNLEITVE